MGTKQLEVSRYSDEDLQMFEELIDQRIAKARSQMDFYKAQIAELGENEDAKFKNLSESTTASDAERLYDMASRQRKLIQHLENAKLRIHNKVYGICRETGKLISKERLMAVPHATLSIEAKQRK